MGGKVSLKFLQILPHHEPAIYIDIGHQQQIDTFDLSGDCHREELVFWSFSDSIPQVRVSKLIFSLHFLETAVTMKAAVLAGKVSYELVMMIGKKQYFLVPEFSKAIPGLKNFYASVMNGTWRTVPIKDAASYLFEGIKILGFFCVGEMIGRGSVVAYQIPGYIFIELPICLSYQ